MVCMTLVVGGTEPEIEEVEKHASNPRGRGGRRGPTGRAAVALPSPCRRQQTTYYTLIVNGMPANEISVSFVQTVHTAGIGAGVFLGLLWPVKGDKITPTEHCITPVRAAYLKTQRGDDKNFCTESHGLELAKNEGAIGRVYITTALQGLRDLVRQRRRREGLAWYGSRRRRGGLALEACVTWHGSRWRREGVAGKGHRSSAARDSRRLPRARAGAQLRRASATWHGSYSASGSAWYGS